MSKTERLYHLHNILNQRRTPIGRQDLMERLECSQATLYRLVAELRDFLGAPIEQDPDNRGFYYDRSYEQPFELPGIWISPAELQALLTAREVLGNVQPGLLENELDSLQGRINSLLQQKGVDPDSEKSRINILQAAGRPVPSRMFQDVLGTLVGRKRLHIRYHGRANDEISERDVSPQRLTNYRGRWYLDAWCHVKNGLRSFALERIQQQLLLDQAAQEVSAQEMEAHFGASYGIFSGPADHQAELLFDADRARWVADETWHPDQQGEMLEDGRYRLRIPFSNPSELLMDILQFGAEVEVVAPDFLRDMVKQSLEDSRDRYK